MLVTLLFAAFGGSLILGVWTDIRERRVSNRLVLIVAMVSIIASLLRLSEAGSLLGAVLGFLVGLVVWLPFWIVGLLGAGDVKFFAAGATWLGPQLSWRAAVLAALLGGVLSLVVLVYRRGFGASMQTVLVNTEQARAIIANADVSGADAAARTFPYALPMAIAIAFAAMQPDRLFRLFGA